MKSILRNVLRKICMVPFRGRHRLANTLGKFLASSNTEVINISGIPFPINHQAENNRYIYYGLYEPEFIAHLRKVLREGDVMIDPGANIGYVSAIASGKVGKSGRVFSIEPSQLCYNQISNYLLKNSNDNITLIPAALSDKTGQSVFYDTPQVITRGFATLGEISKPSHGVNYPIATISVDDLCVKYHINEVRYLKLDIEGSELLALKGAKGMLLSKKIDFVLVETNFSDKCKNINNEVYQIFTQNQYLPYLANKSGKLKKVDYNSVKNVRFDIIWTHITP